MRTLARKVKSWMKPGKRPSPDGSLPLLEHEKAVLYALFEAVTAHPGFPPERFLRFLDSMPDLVAECRAAVLLLDREAARRFKGPGFRVLTGDARHSVLEGLLRKYPYRSSQLALLDRFGLTADNLDLVLASRESKCLRQFVVREFVAFYYDEPEGWRVAGYAKARGHALEEVGEAEVIRRIERAGRRWLELADGTFEAEDEVVPADPTGATVWVKGGRQIARFSPAVGSGLEEARKRARVVSPEMNEISA